jgi:hypothetical protein
MCQITALHQNELDPDVLLTKALLKNLRAKTIRQRLDGVNASAALMRDLQTRSDRGELRYVALYSGALKASQTPEEATIQALRDVKKPRLNQYVKSGEPQAPGTRMLMGVVWVTVENLEKGARFPEVASLDVTCKTNNEERPFFKVTGLDGDGRVFNRANALLWDESVDAFNFVLDVALPALWGDANCKATATILSDGDPHEITAINTAIENGAFTNATRRRCFWHAVHQSFTKEFGTGDMYKEQNKVVRTWLNNIAYRTEHTADQNESFRLLRAWIMSSVDASPLTRRKKDRAQRTRVDAMLTWLNGVSSVAKDWSKASRTGLCDLGHITTAISESANAMLKLGNFGVNPRMDVHQTVARSIAQEAIRSKEQLRLAEKRVNSTPLLTAKQLSVEVATVGTFLTRRGASKLSIQYELAKLMSVCVHEPAQSWHVSKPRQQGDSDSEELSDCRDAPWPTFQYTRTVELRDGVLFCNCGYTASELLPCRHIIAVKRGRLCPSDCHFRYSAAWQAGLVPLSNLSRTFEDLTFGVTTLGINDEAAGAYIRRKLSRHVHLCVE